MSRRHRLAVAALLAAVPALLPATASAAKKPNLGAAAAFEVVRVDIRGERTSRLVDDETVYAYRGIARYQTSVDEQGKLVIPAAAKRRLPSVLVVRGQEYNGLSDAKITTRTGVYDCSTEAEGMWSPNSFTGVVAVRGQKLVIGWQLVPPPMRCPPEALVWSLPSPPSRVLTRQYKLSDLMRLRRGRETRMTIRIDSKWRDGDSQESIRWNGYVQVKRVR